MAAKFTDLTGRWLGRYEYDSGGAPVPFEADIDGRSGDFSGRSVEPNTFRRDAGAELVAALEGVWSAPDVQFSKRYTSFSEDDFPAYVGVVNVSLTRIDGCWHFPKTPSFGGAFSMVRKPLATAKSEAKKSAPAEPEAVGR